MLYHSDNARISAIVKIRELREKIGTISGDQLDYISARQIASFLSMLENEIMTESRTQRERNTKQCL